jgi:hypothetical protein
MYKQRKERNAGRVPSHRPSKLVKLTIAFVCFSCWTSASGAEVQANEDPVGLLQRIRSKIAEHLSRLSNYTCHVEIARLERTVNSSSFGRRDSVELEVAFVGDRELFSRPGQAQFAEQPISQIVPDGMIGNDAFGSHDDDVFLRDGPTIKYAGSCKRDGHKTFRYNFRVRCFHGRDGSLSGLFLGGHRDAGHGAAGVEDGSYPALRGNQFNRKIDAVPGCARRKLRLCLAAPFRIDVVRSTRQLPMEHDHAKTLPGIQRGLDRDLRSASRRRSW